MRCAKFYGTKIDETTVRTEADVQQIINKVSSVVASRGRWETGTFNVYDVKRNLVFALRAYSRFAQANFPHDASTEPPKAEVVKRTLSSARQDNRRSFRRQ